MSEETHYLITTPKYKFFITESRSNMQYYDDYKIHVGGNKKGCVIILVSTPPSNARYSFVDPTVAVIDKVSFDPRCAISMTNTIGLERGEGTRFMVLIAMSYVKTRFPFVQKFELIDASVIKCNDIEVMLPHYYMVLYSQTWYQRSFRAVMKSQEVHNTYLEYTSKFNDPKHKMVLQEFLRKFPSFKLYAPFVAIYESCETYNELFQKLREIDRSLFCHIIATDIFHFVNYLLQNISLNSTWIIKDLSILPDIDKFTIQRVAQKPDYDPDPVVGGRVLSRVSVPSQNWGLDDKDMDNPDRKETAKHLSQRYAS